MESFQSPEAAAEGLLLDVCRILESLEFVIVGGWTPYFRAHHSSLKHPGTRDVDVLFRRDQKTLETAVSRLLAAGYLISAKHRFQLFKTIDVNGYNLVFNVDLLHPLEHGIDADMQHDIMALDIPDGTEADQRMRMKSICFSASDIIFAEDLWGDFDIRGEKIPLLDVAGSVLSKCTSVKVLKRERDSFDQYVNLTGESGIASASRLSALALSYEEVANQLLAFSEHLQTKADLFDKNVRKYATSPLFGSPANELLAILQSARTI